MRRSRSRSRSPAALAACGLALVLGAPRAARAQACCAGASSLAPARLAAHEDALVGVRAQLTDVYGSVDPRGHYVGAPSGASELGFEQDVLGTVRLVERGQLSTLVPFVETWRRAQGASQGGGGIGDVGVSFRYDFTLAGASPTIPGIAVITGATFPTGRTPERASPPLASDATGLGMMQGKLGLALEQTYGQLLLNLTSSVVVSASRDLGGGHRAHEAPLLDVSAAAGYFDHQGDAVAFTAEYAAHFGSSLDGVAQPDSARGLLRLGVSAGRPAFDTWRVQGAIFADPPIPHVDFGQPLGLGLSFLLIRAW